MNCAYRLLLPFCTACEREAAVASLGMSYALPGYMCVCAVLHRVMLSFDSVVYLGISAWPGSVTHWR